MSLDDLRAQAHALNKTLALAAVEMNELTVALQNYQLDPTVVDRINTDPTSWHEQNEQEIIDLRRPPQG